MTTSGTRPSAASLATILLCGGLVVTIAMGIRHPFGFFLQPMSKDFAWPRETFSFAMALSNLTWGATQPFIGMIADRFGAVKVVGIGALLYVAGLALMPLSSTGLLLSLSVGVLIGVALSCTTFTTIYGVVGRNVPAEKRSQALGIVGAAGSFGQFLMVPIEQSMISAIGWQSTALALAVIAFAMFPLALGLRESGHGNLADQFRQSAGSAMKEAFRNSSFLLLTTGFFVCGFQVVFIGVHLPSYIKDHGLPAQVAVIALMLIGLFNIVGTLVAGQLGGRFPKRYLLAAIYIGRSVVTVLFLLAPISPWSVYFFAAAMGLLWLSTVPLTNGIIAQIFGTQYMSMLGGFVFFSHQIGSFLGAWLGGFFYDRFGTYNMVWGLSIALGIVAAIINWPIKERAIVRPQPAAAAG
jgi:MFS family permease